MIDSLSCSISQQFAYYAFFQISSTAKTKVETPLPTIFAPWLQSFKNIVYFSATCHLTTVVFCLLNIFLGVDGRWFWVAGLVLTLAHAYPIKTGLRFMKIKEEDWRVMQNGEIRKMLGVFVGVNKERLKLVDVAGFGFVLAAAMRGICL